MPLSIKEIINLGTRVVVYAGDEVIITWNLSKTLQAWGRVEEDIYQELQARTLEDIPLTIEGVVVAAEKFYLGNLFSTGNRF